MYRYYNFFLRKKKWVIFFSLALFVLFNFIQLNMMNVLSVYIMRLFDINAAKLGFISAAYFYTNLIFIFFSGILLDSFSPKRIMMMAISISLCGVVYFMVVPSTFSLIVWRLAAGLTCSFSITGSFKIVSQYFHTKERGLVIGLIGMVATLAGIISQVPLSLALQKLGVNGVFLILVCLGAFSFCLIGIFVSNHLTKFEHNLTEVVRTTGQIFISLKNWCAALFECFINLPLFVLGALWGSIYLINTYNISSNSAATIVSMLFLGHMIGSPIFGLLTDRMNSRKILILIGAGIAVISGLLINFFSYYTFHMIILTLLFLLLGLSTGSQIVTDAFVIGNNKGRNTARAISLLSLVSVSGGLIFQPLFGVIVQHGETMQQALLVMILAPFLALIFGLYIPNKKIIRDGMAVNEVNNLVIEKQ